MNANDVASEGLGLISRLADEARSVAMVAGYVALPSSSGGPCSTWRARRGDGCRRSDRGRANRRREGTEQRRRFASLSWPCHPADAMARLKALVPIAPETTVLPEQFRLQAKTDAFLPAKRLMVAVLERALGEYETYAARTDWPGRRQFAEVEAWFASDDTGWPFSFVPICEALGLDVPSVRARLRLCHAQARRVALRATGGTREAGIRFRLAVRSQRACRDGADTRGSLLR